MIFSNLAEGFLYGLSLSTLCFISCGPIYTSYFLQTKGNWRSSIINFAQLSSSRFLAYILFGIGAGFLGREISSINRSYFTIMSYTLCSLFLLFTSFWFRPKEKGCQMAKWSRFVSSPFILGLVTGVNFCPGFLIAITRAIDLSGPLSGATLFIGFFFGSNIILFPLVFFGMVGNISALNIEFTLLNRKVTLFRFIAMVSAVLVSLFCFYRAGKEVYSLSYRHAKSSEPIDEKDIVSLLDSMKTYILTKDSTTFLPMKQYLGEHKKGLLLFASDTSEIKDSCFIYVDPTWSDMPHDTLKGPGRFILVLSSPDEHTGSYDNAHTEKMVAFLKNFYFKWNRETGSIFNMNRSDFIKNQSN